MMQPEDIVHILQVTTRQGENYLPQQAVDELDQFVPKMKSNEIKSTTTGDYLMRLFKFLLPGFTRVSLSQIHSELVDKLRSDQAGSGKVWEHRAQSPQLPSDLRKRGNAPRES